MRLLQLNRDGEVTLTNDLIAASVIPPYAILSHTWGADKDEVTFEEIRAAAPGVKQKSGYNKIRFCGEQARRDGLDYFWVDSCCINKASYFELSQAINSMFRWYQHAARCYVYLTDLSISASTPVSGSLDTTNHAIFRQSKWFTRGWTLQELLAPSTVEFFSKEGVKFGDKLTLEYQIHEITGISVSALRGMSLSQFSVNERISWAAKRETTLEEDQAYCVLGIFGVHLPLIYGEGMENAMRRLRKEVSASGNIVQPIDASEGQQIAAGLQSLDAVDQSQFLAQTLKRSQNGCLWISRNSKYMTWKDSAVSGMLWVTAKAGCGKTTLAAHIAQKLAAEPESSDPVSSEGSTKSVILNFFFQRTNQDAGRTALVALKTMAAQFVQQQPQVLPILLKRYEHLSSRGGFVWSWAHISSLLRDMLQAQLPNEGIFIIMDAVDECEEGSRIVLIDWIESLGEISYSESQPGALRSSIVKVLVTSRPDGNLLDRLRDFPMLEIQDNDTAEDVRTLIARRVHDFAHHRQLRQDVVDSIARFLEENAKGMFLWVVLIMKELERRDVRLSNEAITTRLARIPLTLMETYQTIIRASLPARREDMWRIIRWLLYACRKPTLEELEAGISLECHITSWHGFSNDLEYLCGSLIRVNGPNSEVDFFHQTARSFLETFVQHSSAEDVAGLVMDAKSANEQLAMIALQYLMEDAKYLDLRKRLVGVRYQDDYIDAMNTFLDRNPFLRYATESWAPHVRAIGKLPSRVALSVRMLLSDPDRRAMIMKLTYFIFKHGSPNVPEINEPLHLASYFNLPELVRMYLHEDGIPTDVASDMNDTPLIWASEQGSAECVEILLHAGADPNEVEFDGWSSLHWAARNGHLDVVLLLLKYGARLNQRDSKGHTPLDWAVDREHWELVNVLQQWNGKMGHNLSTASTAGSYQILTAHPRANRGAWQLWDVRP